MFSTECVRLAKQQPDLAVAIQKISDQFQKMGTAEIIRPADLACFLDLDQNQVRAVLEGFSSTGLLRAEAMVECTHCGMAVLRSDYEQSYEEDGEYCCTGCERRLGSDTIQAITTYRCGTKWPKIPSNSTSKPDTVKRKLLTPQFNTPVGTTWSDIKMRFTTGETLTITINGRHTKVNYSDMGMKDARAHKATKQWKLLNDFADGHGSLTWDSSEATRHNQKRREILSKNLKDYFGIDDDPIEYVQATKGWRIKFEINPVS